MSIAVAGERGRMKYGIAASISAALALESEAWRQSNKAYRGGVAAGRRASGIEIMA